MVDDTQRAVKGAPDGTLLEVEDLETNVNKSFLSISSPFTLWTNVFVFERQTGDAWQHSSRSKPTAATELATVIMDSKSTSGTPLWGRLMGAPAQDKVMAGQMKRTRLCWGVAGREATKRSDVKARWPLQLLQS